jgi:hypothetical protein
MVVSWTGVAASQCATLAPMFVLRLRRSWLGIELNPLELPKVRVVDKMGDRNTSNERRQTGAGASLLRATAARGQ